MLCIGKRQIIDRVQGLVLQSTEIIYLVGATATEIDGSYSISDRILLLWIYESYGWHIRPQKTDLRLIEKIAK